MKGVGRIQFLIILSGLLLAFYSCDSEIENLPEDLGYEYFPLEIGREWVYSTDSIIYALEGLRIDTFSGFIKEVVVEELENTEDSKVYRIERYFKRNISDPWTINSVWTTGREGNKAIKTEENLRFIKLVFPPSEGRRWDGNLFIDVQSQEVKVGGENLQIFRDWDYRIAETGLTQNINGEEITDIIRVREVDEDEILTELKFSYAEYAKNIGLVSREMRFLFTQCTNCPGEWEEKAEKGFILSQKLISYK